MKPNIPYIAWRNRIEELTPSDLRVDDDLLVIRKAPLMDMVKEPVKADATTAIIYERGSAKLSINMQEILIQAPCMVVILQDSTFYAIDSSADLAYKVIIMSKRFTDNLFSGIHPLSQLHDSVYRQPVIMLYDSLYVYEHYLELLISLLKATDSPYRLEAAQHLTLAMFYGYSFSTHQPFETGEKGRQGLYHKFITLLQQHYTHKRSVAYYADRLCITPKYLSEVTKDTCGRSAANIIQERVITECKALLYSTNKSIQEISDLMNFSTQSEFGKYFKRITGISPKQYREEKH